MKHKATVITPTDMMRHRTELCAWAEANGIAPATVSLSPITIRPAGDHAVIEYLAFVLDEEGRKQGQDQVLTVRRTARLVSPLADHGLDAGQLGADDAES